MNSDDDNENQKDVFGVFEINDNIKEEEEEKNEEKKQKIDNKKEQKEKHNKMNIIDNDNNNNNNNNIKNSCVVSKMLEGNDLLSSTHDEIKNIYDSSNDIITIEVNKKNEIKQYDYLEKENDKYILINLNHNNNNFKDHIISCNKTKDRCTHQLDNKISDNELDRNLKISYDHILDDEHINFDTSYNMDDLNYDIIKNKTEKKDIHVREYTLNNDNDKRDIISTKNNDDKFDKKCGFLFLNNELLKGDKECDINDNIMCDDNNIKTCDINDNIICNSNNNIICNSNNNIICNSNNIFYNKEKPFFIDTIKNFKQDIIHNKMFESVSRKGLIFILTIQDVFIKKTKKILCNKCSDELPTFNNINNIFKDMLKINIEKQTSEIYMTKLLEKIKMDFLKTEEYLKKQIRDKIHIINNLNVKNEVLNNTIKKYKEYFYKIKNEEEIKNSRMKINIQKQFLNVTDFLYHLMMHIYSQLTEKNNKLKFLISQLKKLKIYDEKNEQLLKKKKKKKKILKNKIKMKKEDDNDVSNISNRNENKNKSDVYKNNKKKYKNQKYNNKKYSHYHSDDNRSLNIRNTKDLLLSKKGFSDDNNRSEYSSLNSSSICLSNQLCLSDFTHMNTKTTLNRRNKSKYKKNIKKKKNMNSYKNVEESISISCDSNDVIVDKQKRKCHNNSDKNILIKLKKYKHMYEEELKRNKTLKFLLKNKDDEIIQIKTSFKEELEQKEIYLQDEKKKKCDDIYHLKTLLEKEEMNNKQLNDFNESLKKKLDISVCTEKNLNNKLYNLNMLITKERDKNKFLLLQNKRLKYIITQNNCSKDLIYRKLNMNNNTFLKYKMNYPNDPISNIEQKNIYNISMNDSENYISDTFVDSNHNDNIYHMDDIYLHDISDEQIYDNLTDDPLYNGIHKFKSKMLRKYSLGRNRNVSQNNHVKRIHEDIYNNHMVNNKNSYYKYYYDKNPYKNYQMDLSYYSDNSAQVKEKQKKSCLNINLKKKKIKNKDIIKKGSKLVNQFDDDDDKNKKIIIKKEKKNFNHNNKRKNGNNHSNDNIMTNTKNINTTKKKMLDHNNNEQNISEQIRNDIINFDEHNYKKIINNITKEEKEIEKIKDDDLYAIFMQNWNESSMYDNLKNETDINISCSFIKNLNNDDKIYINENNDIPTNTTTTTNNIKSYNNMNIMVNDIDGDHKTKPEQITNDKIKDQFYDVSKNNQIKKINDTNVEKGYNEDITEKKNILFENNNIDNNLSNNKEGSVSPEIITCHINNIENSNIINNQKEKNDNNEVLMTYELYKQNKEKYMHISLKKKKEDHHEGQNKLPHMINNNKNLLIRNILSTNNNNNINNMNNINSNNYNNNNNSPICNEIMKPLELTKNNINDEYTYETSCHDLSLNNSVNEVYNNLINNYDNNNQYHFFQPYESNKRNVTNTDIKNNQDNMIHAEINVATNDNTFMSIPKNIDNLNVVNDNQKEFFKNDENKYHKILPNNSAIQNFGVMYQPEPINESIEGKDKNIDNKISRNEIHLLLNNLSSSKQNICSTNNIDINQHIDKNIINDNHKINDDYIATHDFMKTGGIKCGTNLIDIQKNTLQNNSRVRKNEERDRGVLSRILRKI
ncbi:conserved Plasmodium protein, unknown function [Plasmodium sp. gorilla clade G2]|uniref:conserved Plasmodium protein, unknown function n=1 Tax=Plasmodium sp. gorilla clade G2 TaxID=880535 RepID=UPI000D206A5F|nr:conserved Plasmodium protein, unknown function [Plasmodium sp. gorilla clade G2]SOV14174.1 conserved Plasmodium protein, unknown function [Plasmodium sp. gorilla clade G2]